MLSVEHLNLLMSMTNWLKDVRGFLPIFFVLMFKLKFKCQRTSNRRSMFDYEKAQADYRPNDQPAGYYMTSEISSWAWREPRWKSHRWKEFWHNWAKECNPVSWSSANVWGKLHHSRKSEFEPILVILDSNAKHTLMLTYLLKWICSS